MLDSGRPAVAPMHREWYDTGFWMRQDTWASLQHSYYFAPRKLPLMKKINFFEHILPHGIALAVFLLVTVIFFKPFFFENKVISQYDIQQFEGSAKTIIDYREK